MAKYNYSSIDETYGILKNNTEIFTDSMHQLTSSIYALINLDATLFNNALERNVKLYMEEVVIGSIEAMQIGVQHYTATLKKIYETRAREEIDNGENANLTTEGLENADTNNWNLSQIINEKITAVNTQLSFLREYHGGTTANFDYQETADVYQIIRNCLIDDFSSRLNNFSAIEELEEIRVFFTDIDRFVDHISECIKDGNISYDESNSVTQYDWYGTYKTKAIEALITLGEDYFISRPLNPMSPIELAAFNRIIMDIIDADNLGGVQDFDSARLAKFFNPYDEDRVNFYSAIIGVIAFEYFETDFNKFRLLVGLSEFFFAITTMLPDDAFDVKIEILNGYIFRINGFKVPDDELMFRRFDLGFQIAVPIIGSNSNYMDDDTVNSLIRNIDSYSSTAFLDFILGLAYGIGSTYLLPATLTVTLTEATMILIRDYVEGQKQAITDLQNAEVIASASILDSFSVGVKYTKSGDDFERIEYEFTDYTENLISIINKHVDGANISENDFYTAEGLKNLEYQLLKFRSIFIDRLKEWYDSQGINYNEVMLNAEWASFIVRGGKHEVIKF